MPDHNSQEITLPIRLLPSRRQRFGLIVLIAAALAFSLYVARVRSPLDTKSAILFLFVAGPLFCGLVREVFFLRPKSSYWIEIAKDGMRTSSPILVRHYEWRELAPFTFEVESVEGIKAGLVYIHLPGEKCKIYADDFASRLAPDKENATRIFCEFLNRARKESLAEDLDGRNGKLELPYGLRVAPDGLGAHSERQRALAAWRSHEPMERAALRPQKDRLPDER